MEWIYIIGATIAALIGFKIIFWVIETIRGKPGSVMAEVNRLSAEDKVRVKERDAYFKKQGLRK